ncbi:MAG: transposase [Thermincola sp.]|jgi:hypothetical protein|nr:transposase [Thermincola sp.]
MFGRFEYITNLQYKVKSLESQVDGFQSGEKYRKMRSNFQKQLAEKDQKIKGLKHELAAAHCQTVTVRKHWLQVIEDLEKEHANELRKKEREIKEMEERALRAERRVDELRDKLKEKNSEVYQVKTELEEEQGKNKKLLAQLNRDYENSSIPSSMKPNRKKITNNREKTGKKPGGQPGHPGHGRKRHTPTRVIEIPAPEKYTDSSDYKPTGRMITKQMVHLSINVSADEYTTAEFRNRLTGQRVHAKFPAGVVNDVNYDGSVKAFAFLLNSHCCVSIDKVRSFLADLTDGALIISKGMVSGLCKEFAKNTKTVQDKAYLDLLSAPVMNTDCTSARVNGQNSYVYVCATPDMALYFARAHKGHKGVAGTPVENYQGILVHDHDRTFYNYGSGHQECLVHVLRYLKDSMENEPGLKWNGEMRKLIQEMIHRRNSLEAEADIDPDKLAELKAGFREILDIAREEYEYEPPSDYYKDGYNLFMRMEKYMENHILFLHDKRVPADNNMSERLLRIYKRKQKQVMSFRSFGGLDYLCQSMSVMALLRAQNVNFYKSVVAIFN